MGHGPRDGDHPGCQEPHRRPDPRAEAHPQGRRDPARLRPQRDHDFWLCRPGRPGEDRYVHRGPRLPRGAHEPAGSRADRDASFAAAGPAAVRGLQRGPRHAQRAPVRGRQPVPRPRECQPAQGDQVRGGCALGPVERAVLEHEVPQAALLLWQGHCRGAARPAAHREGPLPSRRGRGLCLLAAGPCR